MPLIDINKLLDEPMINPDKVYKVINLVIKHLNDRTILSMIKPITTEHKPLKYSVLPQCVPLPLPHPAWMRSLADCRHSLINWLIKWLDDNCHHIGSGNINTILV